MTKNVRRANYLVIGILVRKVPDFGKKILLLQAYSYFNLLLEARVLLRRNMASDQLPVTVVHLDFFLTTS